MTTTEPASGTGLHIVSDGVTGLKRRRRSDGFSYVDQDGRAVSRSERARIEALKIPPAWREVWISEDPDAHIQATGYDTRGRKQYLYHRTWRRDRDMAKFDRLEAFGRALPALRAAVRADLAKEGLPREKVIAAVVRVMERTFLRVGSARYAEENRSYGVTTLEEEHVTGASNGRLRLRFPGKGGRCQEIDLDDRRVASVVEEAMDLPGERVFEYVEEGGSVHEVDGSDINAYLNEAMGDGFTSKDFRTWAATTLMVHALHEARDATTGKERQAAVRAAVDRVATLLANTPAVCKKSYIHPAAPAAYLDGTLESMLEERKRMPGLWPQEVLTLALLAADRA